MPERYRATALALRGGQHDDGVIDRLSWQFISCIWTYRSRMAPRVRAVIAEYAGHAEIYVGRSWREANELAAELEHRPPQPGRGDQADLSAAKDDTPPV